MIRLAKEIDIDEILKLTQVCGAHMRQRNIFQWGDSYPNRKVLELDVKRKEIWVLDTASKILGCVVLSEVMDPEYTSVSWRFPNARARYVHRLAVHPNWQRGGLASQLMDFAEELACKSGAQSIRLDTFSRNPGNQQFYENRGYKTCGAIYFPNQSAYPFYCYELLLPIS